MILGHESEMPKSALLRHLGRAGRTLPYDVRGRGRIASTLTSLLLKSGAEPIVHCDMAAGHCLRLDCRVPSHCWSFFSGKYDDEKRAALLSFLRPGGVALDVGARANSGRVESEGFPSACQ
jgi:hypothetical protein